MCGIAGAIDLTGTRRVPPGMLRRMADAIIHRGPDEDGYLDEPGVGFANRRLSIVGLADGKQPIGNEDRSVSRRLQRRILRLSRNQADARRRGAIASPPIATPSSSRISGKIIRKGCSSICTANSPGPVGSAGAGSVILARDRFGICPLYWTGIPMPEANGSCSPRRSRRCWRRGWIEARPDLRGIDQVFNFLAVPGPATCFQGIQLLQPGHYLTIQLGRRRRPGRGAGARSTGKSTFPIRARKIDGTRSEAAGR